MTDIIMQEYEKVLINRYINMHYSALTDEERLRIKAIAQDLETEGCAGVMPYNERRNKVLHAVEQYFEENDVIVPGGFVDFRLKDIYLDAEKIADEAADAFFKEKEYEEFTYLLSLFVSEKESCEEVVHLVFNENDIRLFNKRGRDITEKYEREFFEAAGQKGAGSQDLAISAVIAAAPQKLVLHNVDDSSPLKDALIKIFGSKCKICSGCNICKNC